MITEVLSRQFLYRAGLSNIIDIIIPTLSKQLGPLARKKLILRGSSLIMPSLLHYVISAQYSWGGAHPPIPCLPC